MHPFINRLQQLTIELLASFQYKKIILEVKMMKRILSIFLMLSLIFMSTTISSAQTKTIQDVIKEIINSNFHVHVIGEYQTYNSYGKVTRSNSLNEIPSDSFNSLWISKTEIDNILTPNNKEYLKDILNAGKPIFFIGKSIGQELADYLDYNINLHEELLNDHEVVQVATYVMSTGNGQYSFGNILRNTDISLVKEYEALIVESWLKRDNVNRRGDIGQQGELSKVKPNSFSLISGNEAFAASEVFETIGDNWVLSFGPNEYTFVTDYGHLYEKKRGYYLTSDGDTNYDYTAISMYWEAVPDQNDSWAYTDQLTFRSDISQTSSTTDKIEKYGPYSQPQNSSLSYSVGLDLSGASFTGNWSVDDLDVYNDSCTSCGKIDVDLNYNGGSYANQTSVHQPAFSYNVPNGTTTVYMNNYRHATFYTLSCGMCSGVYDTSSANYNTQIK
jgi:hypothetical protein